MKNILFISGCMAAASLLFSCKDEHLHNDHEAPVISIASPVEDAVYAAGDTIRVQGTVSDNEDLHELLIQLRMGGTVVYSETPEVHGLQSFGIDARFPVEGSMVPGSAHVIVIASDHSENVDSVRIGVILQ